MQEKQPEEQPVEIRKNIEIRGVGGNWKIYKKTESGGGIEIAGDFYVIFDPYLWN